MSQSLIIVGGGGHALVVAEAAATTGWSVRGFVDDHPSAPLGEEPGAAKWVGRLSELESIASRDPGVAWILGIGSAQVRRACLTRLNRVGVHWATVRHPSAITAASARLGRGVFVGPGSVIHTRAAVEDHAIINTGAIVEHECSVGENAHIAPGTVLGGRVRVEADALVGIGARVMLNRTVGAGAVVGCGAVVVKDVPANATVAGVPARQSDGSCAGQC